MSTRTRLIYEVVLFDVSVSLSCRVHTTFHQVSWLLSECVYTVEDLSTCWCGGHWQSRHWL